MDSRQNTILYRLIDEYIKTGVPVSSAALARLLKIKLSPATIRNEYRQLDEEGMICQPYTSAGRVPTDRGYRCYVDQIESRETREPGLRNRIRHEYANLIHEYGRGEFSLTQLLAQLSQTLALASRLPAGQFEQCGFSQLFETADDKMHVLEEVSYWLDHLRLYVSLFQDLEDNETTVYIGEENPFFPSSYTSALMRPVRPVSGPALVMIMLGPKRMDYRRNMAMIDEISQLV